MSGQVWREAGVDPERVHDAAGLLDVLRRLRVSAGNPSLAVLSRRSGVPRSTLHDALSPKRSTLPPWDLVRRLMLACGCDGEQVRALGTAWKRLAAPVPGAGVAATVASSQLPRQLPAPPRFFTGRDKELSLLDQMLAPGGATVAAIGGPGGIGKTWLAVRWAHDNLDRFPDGQLYLDLRGFDPIEEPMPAEAALRSLLDGLGVAAGSVPAEPEAQIGLYRSVIAGRRILVVLDNARDSSQITPLLPGSPTATVLITSRRRLNGLVAAHGAGALELGLFTEYEARSLLARHLGEARLDGAAPVLLRLCAGLPLALGIVAARAAAHPGFPLTVLAEELATARLDALDAGDMAADIRAVFASSYQALGPAAARMFRLLGLAQGAEIGLGAAAALDGGGPAAARAVLGELHRAHLVDEHVPGRFRMHDLVRLYAAERSVAEPAALRRLVDFYLHSAASAGAVLDPDRPLLDLGDPVPGSSPLAFHGRAEAMAWFDAERTHLLAAQRLADDQGWDERVWWLAWAAHNYTRMRGLVHDELTMLNTGLNAAVRLGEPDTVALAQRYLGRTLTVCGRFDEAAAHLRQALSTYDGTGDALGRAYTLHVMAWMEGRRGDLPAAVAAARLSLEIFEGIGRPAWTTDALNSMGWYLALSDDPAALSYCERALELARRHGYREGEANTLHSLGTVHLRSGCPAEALPRFTAARELFDELGHAFNEAQCVMSIGDSHALLGARAEARHAWVQALQLYRAQSRPQEAAEVESRLATC